MSKNNGGPVFPIPAHQVTVGGVRTTYEACPGMSLRDYFAARAMERLASDPQHNNDLESIARRAYILAEDMLLVRENYK